MKLINILGLAGAFIVTYSNVPQMWLFVKQGHAKGISVSSTWIGTIGLLLRTIYLSVTTHWDLIALGPYFFALGCCVLTLYYIYYPKGE
jgi:uncharacterized protein with PQ loop repeat